MGKGRKVRGHLVDKWKMAMKGSEEFGMWLERRDRETECDTINGKECRIKVGCYHLNLSLDGNI